MKYFSFRKMWNKIRLFICRKAYFIAKLFHIAQQYFIRCKAYFIEKSTSVEVLFSGGGGWIRFSAEKPFRGSDVPPARHSLPLPFESTTLSAQNKKTIAKCNCLFVGRAERFRCHIISVIFQLRWSGIFDKSKVLLKLSVSVILYLFHQLASGEYHCRKAI